MCFYGLKLLVPILFVVSFGASFTLLLLMVNEMINLDNDFFFWIMVFLLVFISSVAGYVAMILPKYGFFALGAVFGVVCTMILDELFFETWDPSNVLARVVAIISGNLMNYISMILNLFLRYRVWTFILYLLAKNGDSDHKCDRSLYHSVNILQ